MHVFLFSGVRAYIQTLPPAEQSVIRHQIEVLRSREHAGIHTKQLKGPLRELIVRDHRISYFLIADIIYFVRGFRKKTQKTPPAEIEYAEKAYKAIQEMIGI